MRIKQLPAATALTALAWVLPAVGAHTALPAEQKQGEVVYLTGGVGEEEVRAIESKARNYPMTLEFLVKAEPKAQFAADVKVKIEDYSGKVILEAASDGPFMLVRLPPGRYGIAATLGGETQARHVRLVENQPKRVIFEWNRPPHATASRGDAHG